MQEELMRMQALIDEELRRLGYDTKKEKKNIVYVRMIAVDRISQGQSQWVELTVDVEPGLQHDIELASTGDIVLINKKTDRRYVAINAYVKSINQRADVDFLPMQESIHLICTDFVETVE